MLQLELHHLQLYGGRLGVSIVDSELTKLAILMFKYMDVWSSYLWPKFYIVFRFTPLIFLTFSVVAEEEDKFSTNK